MGYSADGRQLCSNEVLTMMLCKRVLFSELYAESHNRALDAIAIAYQRIDEEGFHNIEVKEVEAWSDMINLDVHVRVYFRDLNPNDYR